MPVKSREFSAKGKRMKAVIILAHPHKQSFNHALYDTAVKTLTNLSVEIHAHDLYAEKFNPVLSEEELGKKPGNDELIRQYTCELLDSELLIFIHPNWWGQPPAILKGFIDRVIRPPQIYDFPENDSGGGLPIGKLKGKIGVVFNTSNTDKDREDQYFHDPLEYIWKKCIFGFCGIEESCRTMFRIVADSSLAERQKWLEQASEILKTIVLIKRKP